MSNSPKPEELNIDKHKDRLSLKQWEYINAAILYPDKNLKQLAEYIGVSPTTVYGWNTKAPHVEEALQDALSDIHNAGIRKRRQHLLDAVNTLAELLNDEDSNVRLRAAKEIIEGELGKAVSRNEISNAGDSELTIKVVYEDALGSGD